MKTLRRSHNAGPAVFHAVLLLAVTALCDATWSDEARSETVARAAGASIAASYDLARLNSYIARVEWRIVHHEAHSTQICGDAGSATFLGGNLFLSAAHVVDENPLTNPCAAFGEADPIIEFGGAELRAKVVAATHWTDNGGLYYPAGADLALLEVDAQMMPLALRVAGFLAVCESDLSPGGAETRIGTQYGDFSSVTARRVNDDFARVSFAARPGHSGAGVFDPGRGCLLGILSNGGVNGANYVSNANLRAFLGGIYPAAFKVAEPNVIGLLRSWPAAVVATSPNLEPTPR
jgi:trypsin-like peptidase